MVRCALKVAAEQNPWTVTNHPEHLALQHSSPCGRVYLTTPLTDAAVTSCLCAAERQIRLLWCWLTRRCSTHALSLWETGRCQFFGCNIFFWTRCCVFYRRQSESMLSYAEETHTLVWEPKLLQRSEYFELPPNCNLCLGHVAWELLIPAILPECK